MIYNICWDPNIKSRDFRYTECAHSRMESTKKSPKNVQANFKLPTIDISDWTQSAGTILLLINHYRYIFNGRSSFLFHL